MSIKCSTLNNGLRVITEQSEQIHTASVGIWVERGARHESLEQNGIAHFLEHMAFKGTTTRTAKDIAEAIENVGGYINAYTAKDMTAYYARVMGADVPLALDVLTDILANPLFSQREIEVERGVILQEIGQNRDTPDELIFDWLTENSFPNQALGRSILGTEERVKAFHAEDFQQFIHENYGGKNLIISASGAVEHQAIMGLAEEALGNLPYQSAQSEENAQFQSGIFVKNKALEQAHFALSLPAPSAHDNEKYAAHLMVNMLGGGMSSRLFQELRENRGLCYTIFSSLNIYKDFGQLLIYSGTSAEDLPELMENIRNESVNLAKNFTDDELARAKAQTRTGAAMAMEVFSNRAERNAQQLIYHDKIISIEESLQAIEAVTAKDIQDICEKIFANLPQIALYGPIDEGVDWGKSWFEGA